MKLLALCLLWILGVTVSLGAQAPVTSLKLPQDEVLPLIPRQQTIFCLPSTELEFVSFDKAFFHDLLVDIELLSTEITFPWYSVKGVSKDDFEIQIEKLLHQLFKDKNETYVEMELYQRKGFLRDVLSSCPNPIFSSNKIECQMRFSPLDTACVLITPLPSENFVNIKVSLSFNYQYFIRLLIGLFLLLTAHEVSKSKLFQFLSGALLFFTFGIVITLWIIYNRVTNPRNTFSVFNNIFAVSMLLSYGATVIWYLRMNFRTLLLDYWQFSAGYALLSSFIGLVSTGVARRSSSVKHFIVVLVKWFLRLLGALFIYQSFSSPRISLVASLMLLFAYVFYAFRKSLSKRFLKKKN